MERKQSASEVDCISDGSELPAMDFIQPEQRSAPLGSGPQKMTKFKTFEMPETGSGSSLLEVPNAIPHTRSLPQKPILIFLTPDPHKGFGPARDHTELQKNAFPHRECFRRTVIWFAGVNPHRYNDSRKS